MTEIDIEYPVLGRGTNRHGISMKSFPNLKGFSSKQETTFVLNLSNDIAIGILDWRQLLRKAAGTDPIAARPGLPNSRPDAGVRDCRCADIDRNVSEPAVRRENCASATNRHPACDGSVHPCLEFADGAVASG